MYIPIVFGVNVYGDVPPFLGFFYKFAEQAYKYNWPIIAQEEYFMDPNYYKEKYNYDIEKNFEIHNIKSINIDTLQKIKKYIIPNSIVESIIEKNGNIDNAWIKIMNTRYPALEKFLIDTLNQIKEDSKLPIKAILVWRHNETISYIADKMGIKVIEMEFTSMRYPVYNELIAYFQFTNKFDTKEFNERFSKYEKEENSDIPILTRKEILSIFLNKEYIHYINKIDENEIYDYGIALGLEKDYESKSTFSLSNQDVINFGEKLSETNNVLYRKHPASQFKFNENSNIDDSNNSVEFILKCKRIISCLSNISFEAMLYGKTSYILGKMPYQKCGVAKEYISEEVVNLEKLNYIIFGFYVPYDLMLEKDYLDFRMSKPSETEIYKKHLDYYLNKRKLNKSILNKKGIERLKEILRVMDYENLEEFISKGKNRLKKEYDETVNQLENYITKYKNLEEERKIEKNSLENYITKYKKLEEERKIEKSSLENVIYNQNIEKQNLKVENEEKSSIIENLNTDINIKTKEIEKYKITIKKLKKEISSKNNELKNKQEFIDNTVNSASWKITRPFRIISNIIKRKK